MHEDILRIVFDYSKNGNIIDKTAIEKIIEIGVISDSLNNEVKNFEISSEKVNIAGYSSLNNSIIINLIGILEEAKKELPFLKLINFNELETILFLNLAVVQALLHELEHAKQFKKYLADENDIESLLIKLNFDNLTSTISETLATLQEVYYKFYQVNPTERLAQIKSNNTIFNILQIIEDITPSLSEIYLKIIFKTLLMGYLDQEKNLVVPTEIFLEGDGVTDIWKEFDFYDANKLTLQKNVCKEYNLAERLLYDLPITKNEYDSLLSKTR